MSSELDIGPLTWVKGEIDLALERAAEALKAFDQNPQDESKLKFAKTHLHQARGALSVVGLEGLTHFADAVEQLLEAVESGAQPYTGDIGAAAGQALTAIRDYLDELVGGGADQPLRLFPQYRALAAARGQAEAQPSELFFPDLSQRPPRREQTAAIQPAEATIRRARFNFQRGLLKWLKRDLGGAAEMRVAIAAIEQTQAQPSARAFWWATLAFFDALANGGAADDIGVRRLCARIDGQIRKLLAGSRTVAERLMRDVLYQVAVSGRSSEQIDCVRAAYRLDQLVPKPEAHRDISPLTPALRAVRDGLTAVKEDWNRFAAGTAIALPQFHERATALAEQAQGLGQVDFSRLLGAIAAVANMLRRDPLRHNEAVALEVATALLLAESALDNFASLDVEFAHQVDVMTGRLTALLRGEGLATLEQPQLDEISRRAQERLLMSQLAREVQTNLAQIEQALDAFFRDPSRGGDLAVLAKPMKQVEGALAMLGESRAVEVLRDCEQRVATFAQPDYVADQDDFEAVAGKLSALGFFVDRLQHGAADIDAILTPGPARLAPSEEAEAVPTPSLEAELAQTTRDTQTLVEAIREKPEDESLRGEIRQHLETIREDASLVANATLEQQAQAAIAALEAAAPEAIAQVEEAVAQMAAGAPVSAAPSAETARLAASSEAEIDAELLAIFVEEAHEVLAAIADNLQRVQAQPHDREALTTIRRSFHTLKGSGRMVGLGELGEAAWAVEQVMNRWLQAELDATPALLDMIGQAHTLFADWVAQLDAGGGAHHEAAALLAACAGLREGEGVAPAVAAPAAPPAPVAPVEEVVLEAPAEMPSAVAVGGLSLSPTLFQMYLQEARTHLAALDRELGMVGAPPPSEMIRAAHTLAGISATVGIAAVNQLAHALEGALVRLAGARASADTMQQGLLAASVATLADMVEAIAAQRLPGAEDALVDALARVAPPAIEEVAAEPVLAVAAEFPAAEILTLPDAAAAELAEEALPPLPAGEPIVVAEASLAAPEAAAPVVVPPPPAVEAAPVEAPLAEVIPIGRATISAAAPAEVAPAPVVPVEAVPAEVVAEPLSAEAHAADHERRRLRLADDLDPQLLPIFLEEAADLTREIGAELRHWRAAPADGAAAQQLKRLLHTLKGSARMAGAMTVGELVHSMESRIEQIGATPPTSFLDEMDGSFDRVHAMVEALRLPPPAPEAPPVVAAPEEHHAVVAPAPAVSIAVPAEAEAEAVATRAQLRVRADVVDKLANEAGEMAIARSRIEGEMRGLKGSLLDLTENVIRLRSQLREIEIQAESQMLSRQALSSEQKLDFDPLEFDRFTRFQELTRMMAESVNDVTTVQHTLLRNLDHADAAISAQARLNRELSQALMGMRMVPFNSIADRLYRIVRQSAKELDKRANLDIRGGQTELDRSVLEKITGPLEHLLRNAIGHGLESPGERLAGGKADIGQITLAVAQAGNEVSIELADDGKGLDFERIRAKGVDRGLIPAGQPIGDDQLTQLIFMSGFSTAEELTELAGRGVGMDVVKNETAALGGRIEVHTEPGRGTTFRILLPLTLAVTQAVLVRSGSRTFAIPASMVEQVQELRLEAVEQVRADGFAQWLGQTYPYRFLPRLLGDAASQPEPARRYWVLLIKAGAQRLAVEVDALIGNQEIVVKNIGAQLARVVGIAGATVLGNGEIALILNPVALAAREIRLPATAPAEAVPAAVPVAVAAVPTVMVVDDSLTVRKITGRLLAREGYHVITAKDGVDALEQTLDIVPDVMLVDIEMPRMDGFDLTRNVRGDARLKDVPIIMITSRIADKHRNYAREIGVNHYLGKPYDEDELLRLIAGYVKRSAAA